MEAVNEPANMKLIEAIWEEEDRRTQMLVSVVRALLLMLYSTGIFWMGYMLGLKR